MDYDKINVGDSAEISKRFLKKDVVDFANLSMDDNPVHLDEEYAKKTIFKKNIVHGMLVSSLVSSLLGTKLPGKGTIYMKQTLNFLKPVYIGEECTAQVRVLSKKDASHVLVLGISITKNKGETEVISGEAVVKKM